MCRSVAHRGSLRPSSSIRSCSGRRESSDEVSKNASEADGTAGRLGPAALLVLCDAAGPSVPSSGGSHASNPQPTHAAYAAFVIGPTAACGSAERGECRGRNLSSLQPAPALRIEKERNVKAHRICTHGPIHAGGVHSGAHLDFNCCDGTALSVVELSKI